MAELIGGLTNGSQVKVTYSYTQDIPGNSTTIQADLYVHRDEYGPTWASSCTAYVEIDGSRIMTYASSFNVGASWVKIGGTGSITIPHNSDGTKTVSMKGFFDAPDDLSSKMQNLSCSGSVTLPTIPRASSFSLGTSSVEAGKPIVVNVSRYSDSFTHELTFSLGSYSRTISMGGIISYSYTIPLECISEISSDTAKLAAFYLQTKSGSANIGGRVSQTFTVTVPSAIVPTFTALTVNRVDNTVPASWGIYVKDKSKAQLSITGAAGAYGSTIRSYSISGGGFTASSASCTTDPIPTAGTVTYTGTITDSRGRTASKTVSISVADYSTPVMNSFDCYRSGSTGAAQDDGAYARLSAGFSGASVGGKNITSGKYRYRAGSSAWSGYTNLTSGTAAILSGISPESTYTVEVTASDAFTSVARQAIVNSATFLLDFRRGGKGMAIGKAAENDSQLEVGWPASFRGLVSAEQGMNLAGPLNVTGSTRRRDAESGSWKTILDEDAMQTVSSSYGTAVKYANGIMECMVTVSATVSITHPWGSVFESPSVRSVPWPAPFIEKPRVWVNGSGDEVVFVEWGRGETAAETGYFYFYRADSVEKANTYVCYILGIGRWK